MPKIVADFHIHSKYSRATSPKMNLETLAFFSKQKGIDVLGTGDFTHPLWFAELKKLKEKEQGLFTLGNNDVRFILSSEISCIYSKNGKTRKIHMLIIAPDLKTVEKINKKLDQIGNLKADGRPILGLDVKKLVEIALNASERCLCVPCHVWTPWFSLFGSKSGFDTIEECFEDYSKYIYAIETGISSDPLMNQRLSMLKNITLISNSDAHSPAKLMREACVFDTGLDYDSIMNTIKTRKGFLYTIEFFSQEGRYHHDGHRACNISFTPEETNKHNGICPTCGKLLTVGTLNRVEELADEGFKGTIPFKSLIPLREIIADGFGVGVNTKKVALAYESLINQYTEFDILINTSFSDLEKASSNMIANGIIKVRKGEVSITPGYDGEYGKIKIFSKKDQPQKILF